jgi:HTH domain
VTDGEDRERGGLDTDGGRRALMEALGPVAAALGGSLVDQEELGAADIPLRWHGELVGGLRVPAELLDGADDDLHGALGRMIEQVEDELGARLPDLSREGKQRAVRLLDQRGAFLLRRSVEDVADALGVSRITVYNYLNAIRP